MAHPALFSLRATALFGALALLAGVFCPQGASSAQLHYSWGGCNSGVIDETWTGPGTYQQSLCVSGLAADVHDVRVSILVGPSVPDAWTFPDGGGQPGCEPAGAFSLHPDVAGAGTVSVPGVGGTWFPDLTDPRASINVLATYAPATPPDPSVVTAVARIEFDLVNATAQIGASCGSAAFPMCFDIRRAIAEHVGGSVEDLVLAESFVSWNDPTNALGCPGSLPATARTWGRLKAQYR